ncbi:MAG: hypothetical protein JWQ23_3436 [Herminiimonas sp.]|nr:hypothetical protein [Herminiimonas sp.]
MKQGGRLLQAVIPVVPLTNQIARRNSPDDPSSRSVPDLKIGVKNYQLIDWESLREVTWHAACLPVVLRGQEPNVIAKAEQAIV